MKRIILVCFLLLVVACSPLYEIGPTKKWVEENIVSVNINGTKYEVINDSCIIEINQDITLINQRIIDDCCNCTGQYNTKDEICHCYFRSPEYDVSMRWIG